MNATHTISTGGRDLVVALARAATNGLVDTHRAAEAWGVSRATATSRLFRLVRAGWLAVIRRGFFYVLPLEAGTLTTVEDPWVLASQAFSPCYIGGWTAAEHWSLTEQLFRSTFVVTAGAARTTSVTLIGSEFRIVRASKARVASVVPSWRGTARVAVSDRERTLADGLANPEWVGGVRHLVEMLSTYKRSEHWHPKKLLAALASHPKGAAYKRLGYLVETVLGGDDTVVREALAHRSSGVIQLDPQVKAVGKILTRWGLRLNVALPSQDAS
jgi:predicted transcriptional regulator of viral defense system